MGKVTILNKETSPRDYPLVGNSGESIHFGRREKLEVEESQISEPMRKAIQRGSLVVVSAAQQPVQAIVGENNHSPVQPAGKGQKAKG